VHEAEELVDRRPHRAVRRADHVPLPARQRHVDVDRPEQSQLDLQMRRQPRLQRDSETRAGGLLDRAVGTERADRWPQIVGAEELLGHRARTRALLAQQPRARPELLDTHPAALRQRVVRRRDDDNRVVEKALAYDAVLRRPAADGDVRPMRAQSLEDALAVAHVDTERDLRMARRERLHELRGDVLAGGRHRADPQLGDRAVRGLARGACALIEQADDVGRIRGEHLARGTRTHVAAHPLGQLDPQLAGERGDGGRHRWLGHDELLRGGGHRARADDGQEAAELSDCYSHLANGLGRS
jgi:hypothetical protein